jgi:hypothetical protein
VWPFPEEAARFLWVLLPVFLAQPLLALVELRGRPAGTSSWLELCPLACTASVLLLSLPAIAMAADRYRSAAFNDLPNARGYVAWYIADFDRAKEVAKVHIIIVNAMQAISDQVPASDCIVSVRPDLLNFYSHRHAVDPPLNSTPDPQFVAELKRSGCRYVFVTSTRDRIFPIYLHPLQRLGPHIDAIFQSNYPGSEQLVAALVLNPTMGDTPLADLSRH